MGLAFSVTPQQALATITPTRRRVLVTGATGNIGSYFAEHARERYDLRLSILPGENAQAIQTCGEIVEADLADLERVKQVCEGIDTVVHLAANPSPEATWDELLPANIVGTYNLMVAAKAAGCRRVIYASSIHAVSGYPADVQVKTHDPVNPGDLYGVTKCFGEALGRYMAEQEGLSVIAIRIGGFQPRDKARAEGVAALDAWVSRRDLHQLIERCIDAEQLQFAIFNGISDNRFKRLDLSDARMLVGYDPQDDFADEQPDLAAIELGETRAAHSQADGGQSGIRKDVQ
jgi:NAD(P)-dependent dehydrogenase (short-subunit alcohol dehydrogenase family)